VCHYPAAFLYPVTITPFLSPHLIPVTVLYTRHRGVPRYVCSFWARQDLIDALQTRLHILVLGKITYQRLT
jgi:hypothetical protein